MKQWALKSVVENLNYDNVTYSDCHDNFIEWVDNKFLNKIDIIDIGGGNGRVMLRLNPYINNYFNLELNIENIRIGSNFFRNQKNIHFIEFDIDEQEIIDMEVDVVYIDSVLTMLDDPFEALIKFKKVSKYTFVNRTILGQTTLKESYKWGGMDQPSTLWKFGMEDMKVFCEKNKMKLVLLDGISFYIENNLSE